MRREQGAMVEVEIRKTDLSRCHPLLRKGGGGDSKHGFSSSQMESVASICEAFIPSLPPPPPSTNGSIDGRKEKTIKDFYRMSGSDHPLPDQVAELLARRGVSDGLVVVKFILWALSTRIGTLLLCGFRCFSWRFPFIHSFSDMSLEKREQVLQRWTRETFFFPVRLAFLMLKMFCFLVFYTRTDENLWNPAWEAIGYDSPAIKVSSGEETDAKRPLEEGIIEARDHTNSSIIKALSGKGFEIWEDEERIVVECDAVVVGSGCGGGVTAARMAAAGNKVIVVEKGNYFTRSDYSLLEGKSLDQMYEGGGILATVDGKIMLMAGSTIGGGSAVNWSACIKTPEKVMKEWVEEHEIKFYGEDAYIAAMDEVWKRIGVTEGCEEEGLQNRILRQGCENLGLKTDSVARNSSKNHYCGSCGYGCRSGEKRGTDTTWLVDAVQDGAVILTGFKAERFVLKTKNSTTNGKKKRCTGVMAESVVEGGGVMMKIDIRAKVTVSACGSLLTPPLLLATGLENKHIGKNLRLHPVMMVWGYFPEPSPSSAPDHLKGKVYEGGIITSIHKVLSSENDPKITDCHRSIIESPSLGPGSYATLAPWISGADMKQRMANYSRTAHLFALVRDQGAGGVIDSSGKVSYRFDRTDSQNLTAGARRALRILLAAGAVEVGTHRSDGQKLVKNKKTTEEDVEEFLEEVTVAGGPVGKSELWGVYCSAHQMGSCRMGKTDEDGAVDENGECWEADGLFVCDASVLPTAVGVNPMITVQATAYYLAGKIAASPLLKKLV
ncbi:Long-chain fatty alcohol oxidase [Zostera marina]|uniref:Long-chain-alcohol oxidase n=1 Tax=Zostera marina TaxID=29655 RepID=A0A0K9Q0K0_ZOSMR|nr:Long-chain fatty alcohol oxidase [Zostera marina]